MKIDEKQLTDDIRARLSDHRYFHSIEVARSSRRLAAKYGGDEEKAYIAGLMHDVFKELDKKDALEFFASHNFKLSAVELAAPKLWHAMSGAIYLKEKYDFPDDVISAVRYHTTGRVDMTLLEKILFVADFISADRDYDGVEEMRTRANVSLEFAMEEGLRFTIAELAEKCKPIHPDTVAAYNMILTEKERKK